MIIKGAHYKKIERKAQEIISREEWWKRAHDCPDCRGLGVQNNGPNEDPTCWTCKGRGWVGPSNAMTQEMYDEKIKKEQEAAERRPIPGDALYRRPYLEEEAEGQDPRKRRGYFEVRGYCPCGQQGCTDEDRGCRRNSYYPRPGDRIERDG